MKEYRPGLVMEKQIINEEVSGKITQCRPEKENEHFV